MEFEKHHPLTFSYLSVWIGGRWEYCCMKCWQVVHLSTSSALQRILTKILKIIYFTVQFHLILCYYNICFVETHESIVVVFLINSKEKVLFYQDRATFSSAEDYLLFVKHCFSFHFAVILEKTIRIPRSLSVKASSVLKGFLNKNPADRLGCRKETGFVDIVHHPFFKSVDWEMV